MPSHFLQLNQLKVCVSCVSSIFSDRTAFGSVQIKNLVLYAARTMLFYLDVPCNARHE